MTPEERKQELLRSVTEDTKPRNMMNIVHKMVQHDEYGLINEVMQDIKAEDSCPQLLLSLLRFTCISNDKYPNWNNVYYECQKSLTSAGKDWEIVMKGLKLREEGIIPDQSSVRAFHNAGLRMPGIKNPF